MTKVSTSIILIMWCIYSCLQRQLVRLFSCHGTNGLRALQANGLIHEKATETLTTKTTVASLPSWKWWINLSVLHLLPYLVVLWYPNLCKGRQHALIQYHYQPYTTYPVLMLYDFCHWPMSNSFCMEKEFKTVVAFLCKLVEALWLVSTTT